MGDNKGTCFYRHLGFTNLYQILTYHKNVGAQNYITKLCSPLKIQRPYHNQWWFFFFVCTSMKTVWKVRPTEWLKRDVLLFYYVLQCSSKSQLFPNTTSELCTSEELPSATQTQEPIFYCSAELQIKGGFLACGLEKHSRVAPCKIHCIPQRSPVPCPPREQAALHLQWEALLENFQPILMASAFDLTFRIKTFERILKVTFKGCSNLSF